jgi:hypothetical protein
MRSPADMEIIQIDITNACPHICSNCTRFCGHHPKPYFMAEDTFRQAVESLKAFPGTVGVMGGEPTLHPEFEALMEIYREGLVPGRQLTEGREPIADFNAYSQSLLKGIEHGVPGLWTSLGPGYFKNFEIIQELFSFQAINDHTNAGLHQALMVARKDLGIPDEEWYPQRDKCWIQNLWSASITPKGAFFCEVAGALDMLFDGPGGWPVEPGWWKRTPDEFGDQLKWCEMCSACLNVPRTEANRKLDTVSKSVYRQLEDMGSLKVKRGQVEVFDPEQYDPAEYAVDPNNIWFLPESDDRFRVSGTCETIKPRIINAIVLSTSGVTDVVSEHFDRVRVIPHHDSAAFLQAVEESDSVGWIAVFDADVRLPDRFGERIRNTVFNPGCLYTSEVEPFRLFHKRARALRKSDWITAESLEDFFGLWPDDKRVTLRSDFDVVSVCTSEQPTEIMKARHAVSLLRGLEQPGHSVAFFGGGKHAHWLLDKMMTANIPLPCVIYDDHPSEEEIRGIPVRLPEQGACNEEIIVLATDTHAELMRTRCEELWGDAVTTVNLYAELED